MRVLLGPEGGNHYPSFSEDPLAPFEGLRFDLEHFASAFLLDDAQEFARRVRDAEKSKSTKGLARLP